MNKLIRRTLDKKPLLSFLGKPVFYAFISLILPDTVYIMVIVFILYDVRGEALKYFEDFSLTVSQKKALKVSLYVFSIVAAVAGVVSIKHFNIVNALFILREQILNLIQLN